MKEECKNMDIVIQTSLILSATIETYGGPCQLALIQGQEPCHSTPTKAMQDLDIYIYTHIHIHVYIFVFVFNFLLQGRLQGQRAHMKGQEDERDWGT